MAGEDAKDVSVFRDRSISYLELPARDIESMATFYRTIFDWSIDPDSPESFADGSGHVIGHFVDDIEVAGERGPRPYVYTDDIDAMISTITDAGGSIVKDKYDEGGSLWVATFQDPSGNVLGIWQKIPDDQRNQ